ncbi:MAG: peptidase P60, partial [Pseudomonadota bacterium]
MADPRLTPARPDLAAISLKGLVEAQRYAEPTRRAVLAAVTPMLRDRDITLPADTELLAGEQIDIYERDEEWIWGQAVRDGYVGFVAASDVAMTEKPAPTHAVNLLASRCFAVPELKTPSADPLPFGAQVRVLAEKGDFAQIAEAPDLWLLRAHLRPLAETAPDWVAVAEMFLGMPYVWGGRSSFGLDCSALVQLA